MANRQERLWRVRGDAQRAQLGRARARRRPIVRGALLVLGLVALALPATLALARDADKREWQERYRSLLNRQQQLERVIERERTLYAAANRRNYRRGTVRHVHRDKMLEAEAELAGVVAELDTFTEDARRAGALPGWLYEVEAEFEAGLLEEPQPASPDAADLAGEDEDDGRNPLYRDRRR